MSKAVQTTEPINTSLLEQVVIGGDLAKLTPAQRLVYYRDMCRSLGLNPLTKPFAYLTLNNKLVLYAQRDCTDQLRKINGISVELVETKIVSGAFTVIAKASDKSGRADSSTGAVWIDGLKGEAMCNAMMKAETKAKRRVTLSICGLGLMDESEVDSVAGARRVDEPQVTALKGPLPPHDAETGEIKDINPFGFPESEPLGREPELPVAQPAQIDEAARAETWANSAISVIDKIGNGEQLEAWAEKNRNHLARCRTANSEAAMAVTEAIEMRRRALGAMA